MLLSPGMTLADDEDVTHCDGLLSGRTGPYSQQNLLNADGLEISTRCHFFTAGSDTGLTNDRTKFEYDVTADVDAIMNPDGSSCPKELIVFIHGFKGSPSGTFSRALEQLGYDTRVSGADFKLVILTGIRIEWVLTPSFSKGNCF
jgi:hypothetical protein